MVTASAVMSPAPYVLEWDEGMTYPNVSVVAGQSVQFKWPGEALRSHASILLSGNAPIWQYPGREQRDRKIMPGEWTGRHLPTFLRLWILFPWCAGRHGVYMLPKATCPDTFDDNSPNVLATVKVRRPSSDRQLMHLVTESAAPPCTLCHMILCA